MQHRKMLGKFKKKTSLILIVITLIRKALQHCMQLIALNLFV